MSSSNYSIMRSVSTCKQDATIELLVLLHTFFRDKGEAIQKSSSAAEGWHGSYGVLRIMWCCGRIFSLPYYLKKVYNL